jgi:hypothetical protein
MPPLYLKLVLYLMLPLYLKLLLYLMRLLHLMLPLYTGVCVWLIVCTCYIEIASPYCYVLFAGNLLRH